MHFTVETKDWKLYFSVAFHILKLFAKKIENHKPTPFLLLWLWLDKKDVLAFQFLTVNNKRYLSLVELRGVLIEVFEDMSALCVIIPL